MYANITEPQNYLTILNYNENKLEEKKGECIYAGNFLKNADELTLADKRERFDNIVVLNNRVRYKGMHATLNFDRNERLSQEKLIRIAKEYMERVGFGDQPYLVYQHFDAGHPHLHIVSISIRHDGSHIHNSRIGADLSNPARIAIEKKFGLINVKEQGNKEEGISISLPAQKIQYGKLPTKTAIHNTLNYVFENYKFRSLPELNAILRLYNLRADGGKPGSRLHQHRGLIYVILDEKGKKIGVPQKASSFDFQPTLGWLEKKFYDNLALDPVHLKRVQAAINSLLRRGLTNREEFAQALMKAKVQVVGPNESADFLQDIHFVDLRGMQVVAETDLEKDTLAKLAKLPLRKDDQAKKPEDELSLQPQMKKNQKSRKI
jgi:hypothetical protein